MYLTAWCALHEIAHPRPGTHVLFNLSYLFDRTDILGLAMNDLIGWLEVGEIQPPA